VIEPAATASCKVIARYGIGYDSIDVDAAAKTVAAGGWEIEHASIRRLRGRRLAPIGLAGTGDGSRRARALRGEAPQCPVNSIPATVS
jgi:lactate dehydrogenase-like 2-hydroxyacid dehydrogenase